MLEPIRIHVPKLMIANIVLIIATISDSQLSSDARSPRDKAQSLHIVLSLFFKALNRNYVDHLIVL